MKGSSELRLQGYDDPLLVDLMKRHGFDEIPLCKHRPAVSLAKRNGGRASVPFWAGGRRCQGHGQGNAEAEIYPKTEREKGNAADHQR